MYELADGVVEETMRGCAAMMEEFINSSSDDRFLYKSMVGTLDPDMHDRLQLAYGNVEFFVQKVSNCHIFRLSGPIIISMD